MTQAQVALVAGGASGIGAACIRHFVRQGCDVVVNYFSASRRSEAEELIRWTSDSGREAIAVQADVSNEADCRRLADTATQRFGRLDALVCSAGVTRIVPHQDLEALTAEDFLHTTSVNTVGAFQMARACLPPLQQAKEGAIVNCLLLRSHLWHRLVDGLRGLLRKIAQPAEVAADIYWLAAGTKLVTGNVLLLDCGLHLNGGS